MTQPKLAVDLLKNRQTLPGFVIALTRDQVVAEEIFQEAALARLEPFLDQRERHREFREQVDTWASTVWAVSQGVYLPAGPR